MDLKTKTNKNNSDLWLSRLFISVILIKAANLTFNNTDLLPEMLERIFIGLLFLFFLISFFLSIIVYNRKNQGLILAVACIFTLMYFWSYIKYPQIRSSVEKRFLWTVFLNIPVFASIYNIYDFHILYNTVYKYSFLISVFGTMIFIGDTTILSSNTSFSAMMLFPLCIHLTKIENKKIFQIVLCAYEFFIIFSHGSRGSLLVVFIFAILYNLFQKRNKPKITKAKIFAFHAAFLGSVLILLNFENILKYIENKEFSIRNLKFLIEGNFLDTNGRFSIQADYLQKMFLNSPVRFILVDLQNNGTFYPHNIFLEVMWDYGYLLGSLLIIFFVTIFIKRILLCRDSEFKIMMVLFGAGFLPLLFSFTYTEWPLFWALTGYLCKFIKVKGGYTV